MNLNLSLLGHNIAVTPKESAPLQETAEKPIGKKEILEAISTMQTYKEGKSNLENRIVENERWYRLRHWDVIRGANVAGGANAASSPNAPEPTSGWLFNCIANKHADAMDNYPEPNVLPRERGDEQDAKTLSAIIPVILERNDYEETYSDAWWYKLKTGTSCYGVFWNNTLENGLGDIDIKKIDLLNLYWESGITDLQQSRNLFLASLVDDDILLAQYPQLKGKLQSKIIDVRDYVHDDTVNTDNKSVVIDWYYKKNNGSRTVLHYAKFVGETLLYASENEEQYRQRGYYDHGEYPFVFDVLFPEEGTPVGFGYVDICRQPQLYIDKLNQIILQNAYLAGKPRFYIKDTGGVNEEEFADWSKNFVHVAGSLNEENIRQIDTKPLDGYIMNLMQYKVDELKETSGNRDFSQGGTASGVTAASAIAALQEAGNKLSRDMIKGAYRAFAKINYLCIELIRQFYDEARCFRIEGQDGGLQYIDYSNAGLQNQPLPPPYPGAEQEPGYQPGLRRPIFDIRIKPQKSNPYSRMAQNELAKELYGAGFFDPTRADMALGALELMDFEGKAKTVERISQGQTMYRMIGQLQMQLAQLQMALGMANGATGTSGATGGTGAANTAKTGGADPTANAVNTPYAQRIAERTRAGAQGGGGR